MFNSEHIVESGGLLAVALIIFAESGLFFGFIFPGDTLLLAAGFFAGQGKISLFWLITLTIIAAVAGDNVGYRLGQRLGPRMFNRKDGILFRKDYITKTQEFYDRHGGITIVIARFIAYVRTFAPAVAGMGKMPWYRFAFYNVIGGIIWGVGLPLIGYVIGYNFPDLDKYFIWFLIISAHIIAITVAWRILKNRDTRKKLKKMLREEWQHYFKKTN